MGTLTLSLGEVVKGLPLNLFEACLKLTEEPETQSASFGKDGSLSSPENPEWKPNTAAAEYRTFWAKFNFFPIGK